jgi:hypothetical protein
LFFHLKSQNSRTAAEVQYLFGNVRIPASTDLPAGSNRSIM